jgi:N-acetylmuramic acid 6-phosphate etherase
MNDRGGLTTEQTNTHSASFDSLSIADAFDLMNGEDATVAAAVGAARGEICQAIELVAEAFRTGGRLIYVGAGTSGRLGVLDAAECPPTFLSDPAMVQGVIAGGIDALTRSIEGAEDHSDAAIQALEERKVGCRDVVLGIATGGTTPFVHGALAHARQCGAATVFLACIPREQMADEADVSIRVVTGPEVLTGSTRLKAGTATKMVLNMVTTIAMARSGKVYRNYMVDVNTRANVKLIDRGARMLQAILGLSREDALTLLDRAGGRAKTALVMHSRGLDRPAAERMLDEVDGFVGRILE